MEKRKIKKLLIANRGEIALRIQRAATKLGIKTVSIASEVDQNSFFARSAEELVVIGKAAPADSYLNIEKIVAAAKKYKCDAVHPGYGFLSENADFAQAVVDAGLIFVGPDPETIRIMGSKTGARAKVKEFGVPLTPGSASGLSDAELLAEAKRIGWPVIVKAVAGGGGRGMRIVNSDVELKEILPRARAEAKKNFSSEDVYLEKYISQPRHIEVQVFGDGHGNIVHMGTRDCSTQRRHQKLIEEAPAPNLPADIREKIHNAAVNAAKSVNYKNAGTVEMLFDGKDFYFLEMNTRIQVEHPVTEAVTGIDLVELQLKVAQGEKLPFSQNEIRFDGHAIEFRIYAEDPKNNFMPSIGRITKLRRLEWSFCREDGAYTEGDEISMFYDAMISKLIVHGGTRSDAIEKSGQVLNSYQIEGVRSSVDYHLWLIYNTPFRYNPVDIGFVEREFGTKTIRELEATRARDPKHQKPLGGMEVKHLYEYTSEKYNTTYTIEVLHRKDGFFIARPVDKEGHRAPNKNCRMSNGLDNVMRSIQDVLETTSPKELFTLN